MMNLNSHFDSSDPYLGEDHHQVEHNFNSQQKRSNLNDVFFLNDFEHPVTVFVENETSSEENRIEEKNSMIASASVLLSYDSKTEMNSRTKWMWCNDAKINILILNK